MKLIFKGGRTIEESLKYCVKSRYWDLLEYLYRVAQETEEGYFYLKVNECMKTINIAKRTLYRYMEKLNEFVFRVYEGSRYTDDQLRIELLRDAGKTFNGTGSLYYMPLAHHTGILEYPELYSKLRYYTEAVSFKRDKAILKYCFQWHDAVINHFIKWSNSENNLFERYQKYLDYWNSTENIGKIKSLAESPTYLLLEKSAKNVSDNGFLSCTEEKLNQFVKYMIKGDFDWYATEYMDIFVDHMNRYSSLSYS